MSDDYKVKLSKFFGNNIPMKPLEIPSGAAKPTPYDAAFKQQLAAPRFTLPTTPLFMQYTQTPHLVMVKDWAKGGEMTACNGLAGTCAKMMGAKDALGTFKLENLLGKIGKRHAWVRADSGQRPDYGDIFVLSAKLHMGVSLGFEGDDWLTVEAGQGGPAKGYDALQRKRQTFDPSTLRGWCDMWLYLDPRAPLPDWLVGTWVIYCDNKNYHYQFNKYYEAFYYSSQPIGSPQNAHPMDTGTVSYQGFDCFTVTWQKEGGVEKFNYDRFDSFPGLNEKMTGATSRGEVLKGVRL